MLRTESIAAPLLAGLLLAQPAVAGTRPVQVLPEHPVQCATPGVDDGRVRIGTLLPLRGPLADAGQAVRDLLEGLFARINAAGGVHGRRLELVVAEYVGEPQRSLDNLGRLLAGDGGVLALLSPFAAGFEHELTDLARARGLPVIAPVVLELDNRPAANSHVFHLLSGGTELAQVLADYALDSLGLAGDQIVLLQTSDAASQTAGSEVAAHLAARKAGTPQREIVRAGPAELDRIVAASRQCGGKALILLGGGVDPAEVGKVAARAGWYPELLVPGPFATRGVMGLPRGFAGKVFVAYPNLPVDRDKADWARYQALLEQAGIRQAPHATLVASYSGAELLLEALKRAGREPSRESMLLGLEKMQDFDSGLLPPFSYDATRRIGALGGYVVGVDLALRVYRPIGAWRRLN